MNPLATRHSDEYSATVKSDLLGILFMGSPVSSETRNEFYRWGSDTIAAQAVTLTLTVMTLNASVGPTKLPATGTT